MMRQSILLAGALLFAAVLLLGIQDPQEVALPAGSTLSKNVAVPMRDGVILRADVLLPRPGGRFPTLVYRTPYSKDRALPEHTTFAKGVARGYAEIGRAHV